MTNTPYSVALFMNHSADCRRVCDTGAMPSCCMAMTLHIAYIHHARTMTTATKLMTTNGNEIDAVHTLNDNEIDAVHDRCST